MNDRISSAYASVHDVNEIGIYGKLDDDCQDQYAHLKRRDSVEDYEDDAESAEDFSESEDSSEQEADLDEIRIITFIKR